MDEAIRGKYTLVIGLEVHAQLMTATKIFNSDTNAYGSLPNTNISPITLGHPGTLPILNRKAVEHAIRMGLACNSKISRENIFDRKNYFYPDLPKGYQITQDRTPICIGGEVIIKSKDAAQERAVKLNRIHMEEDAGKSIHLDGSTDTLVDFNRAGVPLIEIVTDPDLRSADEAYAFLTEVRKIVRYLGVCDGNMEEGSMRCDANISIMLKGAKEYGKKVEVKNMNSIRNVHRAIEHETERQINELEKGNEILSETRTFDAGDGTTAGMRTKETLNDYRYFPDPDLSPIVVSEEWLDSLKESMPALPRELYLKFQQQYGLPEYDAQVLTDTKEMALYFDGLCQKTAYHKAASNWMMGPVKSFLNDKALVDIPITTGSLAELIELVETEKVSFSAASKKILPELMEQRDKSALQLAEKLNLIQDSDSDSVAPIVEEVIAAMPEKVAAFRKGKKGLLRMFVGEVMKRSRGKANPKLVNELLQKKLG